MSEPHTNHLCIHIDGEGLTWIGECVLCGKTGITPAMISESCPNPRGVVKGPHTDLKLPDEERDTLLRRAVGHPDNPRTKKDHDA